MSSLYFKVSLLHDEENLNRGKIRSSKAIIDRKVDYSGISEMDKYDLMPGFRLSWYYTGMEFTPDPLMKFPEFEYEFKYYKDEFKYYKDFVRYVSV